MNGGLLIGILLFVVAIVDGIVGFLVVLPRVPDPGTKKAVGISFILSSMVMIVLGILFMMGII